jgi:hypothetical protein
VTLSVTSEERQGNFHDNLRQWAPLGMMLEPATGWACPTLAKLGMSRTPTSRSHLKAEYFRTVSRDESRAGARVERDMFRLCRACDAALWSQVTGRWISGPTHRRARTPVERCKRAARRTSLLQAWQPRTQDRGARSEPNQIARSTDPGRKRSGSISSS